MSESSVCRHERLSVLSGDCVDCGATARTLLIAARQERDEARADAQRRADILASQTLEAMAFLARAQKAEETLAGTQGELEAARAALPLWVTDERTVRAYVDESGEEREETEPVPLAECIGQLADECESVIARLDRAERASCEACRALEPPDCGCEGETGFFCTPHATVDRYVMREHRLRALLAEADKHTLHGLASAIREVLGE